LQRPSSRPVVIQRAAPLERRFATDDGRLGGYGSVFGVQDSFGDVVLPGAFAASIASHRAAGTMPAMLWQHDAAEPIGLWTDAREDDHGLYVEGALNTETMRGREAAALVRQGALNGLSIGFLTPNDGAEYDRQTGVRRLRKLDLWEVSVVTFPANGSARLGDAIHSRIEFEKFLRSHGFAKGAARALASGGWSALTATSPTTDETKARRFLEKVEAASRSFKERS